MNITVNNNIELFLGLEILYRFVLVQHFIKRCAASEIVNRLVYGAISKIGLLRIFLLQFILFGYFASSFEMAAIHTRM